MFVACGIWCLADVSSVSPSSEQTEYSTDIEFDNALRFALKERGSLDLKLKPKQLEVVTAVVLQGGMF